jgi:hypothetical protein
MRTDWALAAALAGCAAIAAITNLAAANSTGSPVEFLAGRWVGPGQLVPASGPNQPFECVVTYIQQPATGALRQSLRCKSDNVKFEAKADLLINGDTITGHWEDRVNSVEGPVAGRVTPNGFELDLQGQYFQATMAVAGSHCAHTVTVSPLKADYIREISANLKKC